MNPEYRWKGFPEEATLAEVVGADVDTLVFLLSGFAFALFASFSASGALLRGSAAAWCG